MLIIFEGMDKSGKTTLLDKFNKDTNYKHVVLDRGVISSFVYDKIYRRNFRQGYNFFVDMLKDTNHVVFVCTASPIRIQKRLEEHNEELVGVQKKIDIEKIQSMFIEEAIELMRKGINVYFINTDKDVDEAIQTIHSTINKFE